MLPVLDFVVTSGGAPFPLSDSEVTFSMAEVGGGLVIDHREAEVVNPTATDPTDADAGLVRYAWVAGDTDVANEYAGWFTVQGQDLATTFEIAIIENFPDPNTVGGKYTNAWKLKDFTGIPALKAAPDEWLNENLIPRAEAWIDSLGPFKPGSVCAGRLTLAANVLAERIFLNLQPELTRTWGSVGNKKSETIGRYSYTLSEVASADPSQWNATLDEISRILGDCIDWDAMGAAGLGMAGGGVQVFPLLSGYEHGGSFDIEEETHVFRAYFSDRGPTNRWIGR